MAFNRPIGIGYLRFVIRTRNRKRWKWLPLPLYQSTAIGLQIWWGKRTIDFGISCKNKPYLLFK